jgi:hypothetical protein
MRRRPLLQPVETSQAVNFLKESFRIVDRPVSPLRLKYMVERDTWNVINPELPARHFPDKAHKQVAGREQASPVTQFRPSKKLIRSCSMGVWKSLTWDQPV